MLPAHRVNHRLIPRLVIQSLLVMGIFFMGHVSTVHADPHPPHTNDAHFEPVDWPSEPADPRQCGDTCDEWIPYTLGNQTLNDPRTQDPSHGGARPQNYVNISSSCTDQALPSIYYAYDSDNNVLFFRWRVEQIANTYGAGPKAGSYSNVDPWNSALWTVFFDVDGDGFRDLAAHLDGQSGVPGTEIDRLFGIWGDIPTQSVDYEDNPDIHVLGHNSTAFVDETTGRVLNFQNSNSPTAEWPNGSSETTWDYGTTRSRLITKNNVDGATCDEYFIDYQIPLDMLDASDLGGPKITSDTPFSMLFCTANSLNDPMQKDCIYNGDFITDPNKPAPYGDVITPDGGAVQEPLVHSVTASGCDSTTLTAEVQDAIEMVGGVAQTTVSNVDFSYYFDANGNGEADDGGSWTHAATGTAQDLRTWTASWNTTTLPKGQYLISAQATDKQSNTSAAVGTLTATMVNTCGAPPASIHKNVTPDSVTVGEIVTFTVTISNTSGAALALDTITDTLPIGFTYDSTTGDGTLGSSSPITSTNEGAETIVWSFSGVSIPAGDSETLVLRAQAPSVVGTYNNVVSAETDAGTLTSDPVPIGVGAPKLLIAKSASAASLSPGEPVTYTIRYANDSPVDVRDAVITDVLPTGLLFDSALDGGVESGGVITWSVGDIASGDGPFEVRFTATVDDPYPDAAAIPLVNTATIDAPDTDPASASAAIHVDAPRPELVLQKEANTALISPGELVTFTLRYANTGSGSATNVVITDTIPAGFTYISATPAPDSNDGGVVAWSINDVSAGQTGSVELTIQAADPFEAPNPATNTATIDSGQTDPLADTYDVGVIQTGQACSTYYFHDELKDVGAHGSSKIGNETAVQPADIGSSTTITVPGTGIYVEAVRFYQDPASNGTINLTGNITTSIYIDRSSGPGITLLADVYDYDSSSITPTLLFSTTQSFQGSDRGLFEFSGTVGGTLQKGHRLLWVFSVRSNNSQSTKLQFQYDGTVPNNESTGSTYAPSRAQFCITPPADIYLDKTVSDLAVRAGDTLTYTIDFGNIGESDATGAVITDTLPTGVTFESATLNGSPITPTISSGQVHSFAIKSTGTITDGQISGGQSGTLQIVARVDQPLGDGIAELLNTAELESDQTVLISDTATSKIVQSALSIEKRASPTLLAAGDVVTYTLTVGNSGTGAAEGIVISDTLPSTGYFTYVAGSARLDDVQIDPNPVSGSLLRADVESLLPGRSATLTYQMRVETSGLPSGITEIGNTAAVTDTGGSVATSAPVTVSISSNPNLRISKSLTPTGALSSGDLLTYTITIRNTGSSDALDVLVRDPIPSDTRFVNGSMVYSGTAQTDSEDGDAGHFDSANNRVRFAVGTLSSGATRTMRFTVRVDDSLPNGVTAIANTATVNASNSSAKTASADTQADAAPVLTVDKTGPGTAAHPLATLSADASGDTILQVNDTSLLKQDQFIDIGGSTVQITAIGTTTITVDSAVTASAGADLIGALTYSIRYENSGDAPATNTVLTDTLPAGSTFVAATDGGIHSSGTVTWSLDTLDPGESSRVQVSILPGGPGALTNTTTIDSDETEPVDDSVVTEVGGLRVTKRTLTPSVAQTDDGTAATYVLQIDNTRSTAANGVLVTDTLGAGFTYSETLAISGYDSNTSEVTPTPGDSDPTWGTFTVPASGQLLITYTVAISSTQGPATYQDFAIATSTDSPVIPFDALTSPDEDVTITLVYDPFPVTKRDALAVDQNSDGNVNPGDTIEYTVVFTNTNDATITGVVFTDTLDNNTTLVVGSVTASSGSVITGNTAGDSSVRVDVGSLASGAAVTVTFRATVDDPLPDGVDEVSNQGTVTSNEVGAVLSDDPDTIDADDPTVTPVSSGGTITGAVYHDLNGDGSFDNGESGLSGVVVSLSNGMTTTTDVNGLYTFTVVSGVYTITESTPPGYQSTGDSSGANDDAIPNVTVTAGQTSGDNNFFDAQPVTIAGRVVEDADADGSLDSGESGIDGVTVSLSTGVTTTTDSSGTYTFTVLPGSYTITETNPVGYASSAAVTGTTGSTVTDADTIAVALTSGQSSTGNTFLDYRPATVTGAVLEDLNGNGSLDSGEPGISGVLVSLSNGVTTTTNASGVYTFTGLTPGTYAITEMNPTGYRSTGDTDGANDDSVTVTVVSGETSSDNHFFDDRPASISGVVFDDANGNGTRDSGEAGIQNVTVTLLKGGSVLSTATTTSGGGFNFGNLTPGSYTVRETDPSGYVSTTDNEIAVTLISGDSKSVNFGDRQQTGTISGVVFNDDNGNGTRDSGEAGIPGVAIALSGDATRTTTTGSGGSYTFSDLTPGDYTVTETDPDGYTSTTDNSVSVTVNAGSTSTVNFGDRQPGGISGIVWHDADGDGATDSGETGITGVTVTLSGDATRTTTTGSDGRYSFSDLAAGSYTVTETDPDGYASTTSNAVSVTLTAGNAATVNFGDWQLATISGRVYEDRNGNGAFDNGEPGIAGVTVALAGGSSTTTDSSGAYAFTVAPGTYTVTESDPSDYASTGDSDSANDNSIAVTVASGGTSDGNHFFDARPVTISGGVYEDGNGNGARDADEPGLADVTVSLSNGGQATTGTDGSYSFSVLPGSYTVTQRNHSGYTSSGAEPGTTGSSVVDADAIDVTLTSGQSSTGNDFLDFRPATIGGVVFHDEDASGTQNNGEAGIPGVTIELLQNGSVIATVTNGSDGGYTFADLAPGAYTVRETDPAGYVSTTANERSLTLSSGQTASVDFGDRQLGGVSGVVFHDVDGDGTVDAGESGIPGVMVTLTDGSGATRTTTTGSDGSYAFTDLPPGSYTVTETDPDGYVSTTENSVAVTVPAPNGHPGIVTVNFGDRQLSSVGGTVFLDVNGNGAQDGNEDGKSGVTVALVDADGNRVDSTTSAADGSYDFAGVVPAPYTVVIDPPVNHTLTTDNPAAIVVAPGETAEANFGLQLPASQPILISTKRDHLAQDTNDDGAAGPGDAISYTVVITNVGGADATGVLFRDTVDAHTTLLAGSVQSSQGIVSAGDNGFTLPLGTLRPGDVVEITFSVRVRDPLPAEVNEIRNQGLVLSSELPTISTDDPDTHKANDATLTPVQAAPAIDLFKEGALLTDKDNDGATSPGDVVEYRITVVNKGSREATNATLTDAPDRNTRLVPGSVRASQGTIARGNGQSDGSVAVILEDIAPGDTATVAFQVTIADPLPPGVTRIANQAMLHGDNFPTAPSDDPDSDAVDDPTVMPVAVQPRLIATKRDSLAIDADGNGVPSPGDTLVYQVAIRNQGKIAATGVVYQDQPDRNTKLVVGSVQSSQGSVTAGNGAGDKRVRMDVGTVAEGESVTLSYRVTIDSVLPPEVTHVANQGLVSSAELPTLSTNDPDTWEAGDPTRTSVVAAPLLVGSKTDGLFADNDGDGFPSAGDTLIYNVDLRNEGNLTALDVAFNDVPDANTKLVVGSVQSSQGSVTTGNGSGDRTIAVAVGDLPPGGSVSISYRVDIDDPLPDDVEELVNQASFGGSNTGQGFTNDPSTPVVGDVTGTRVGRSTVIEAYKGDVHYEDQEENGEVGSGDVLLYQITLEALGRAPATGVLFADTPDPNTTLIVGSARTSLGTVVSGNSSGDRDVVVDVGTIPLDEQVTISFLVTVTGDLPAGLGIISNQGVASSDAQFSVPTDDPTTPAVDDPTQTDLPGEPHVYLPIIGNPPSIPAQDPTALPPAPEPTPPPTPEPPVSDAACPAEGCTVPGLAHPKAIAYHSGQNALYVTSRDSDQLFKIDAHTNQVLATVPTGNDPWDVVTDEERNRLYVSNFTSGDVWIYDADSLDLVKTVAVSPQAASMTLLPALDTLAVVVRGPNGVALLRNTQLIALMGTTGAGAFGLAADPDHNLLLVVNRDAGHGRILYQHNGAWRNDGPALHFGDRGQRVVPFGAVYHPATHKFYVLYTVSSGRWFVDSFFVPDHSPLAIQKRATIEVGSSGSTRDPNVGGLGLAVHPHAHHLFVTNNADGTVSVIHSGTDQLIETRSVGTDPFAAAVDAVHNRLFVLLRNVNRFQKVFLDEQRARDEAQHLYLPDVGR